jgi:hypothetical protein
MQYVAAVLGRLSLLPTLHWPFGDAFRCARLPLGMSRRRISSKPTSPCTAAKTWRAGFAPTPVLTDIGERLDRMHRLARARGQLRLQYATSCDATLPLPSIDTHNRSEFISDQLITFCADQHINDSIAPYRKAIRPASSRRTAPSCAGLISYGRGGGPTRRARRS